MPANDTITDTTDDERPERKTKTLRNGDVVHEADDCRFVASPAGTVHERDEWPGDAHDYEYHPRCGQRLPPGSLWSHVDAESEAEAVLKYDLKPCTKCIENAYELARQRRKRHSALVMDHVEERTYPFEEEREAATDGGTDQGPLDVYTSDDPTEDPTTVPKETTVVDVGADVFATARPVAETGSPGDDKTVILLRRADAADLYRGLGQVLGHRDKPVRVVTDHPLPSDPDAIADLYESNEQLQHQYDEPPHPDDLRERYQRVLAETGAWRVFEVDLYGFGATRWAWNHALGYGLRFDVRLGDGSSTFDELAQALAAASEEVAYDG